MVLVCRCVVFYNGRRLDAHLAGDEAEIVYR